MALHDVAVEDTSRSVRAITETLAVLAPIAETIAARVVRNADIVANICTTRVPSNKATRGLRHRRCRCGRDSGRAAAAATTRAGARTAVVKEGVWARRVRKIMTLNDEAVEDADGVGWRKGKAQAVRIAVA